MHIIYLTSNNNLFKEIKKWKSVGFWVEMEKSEEMRLYRREQFFKEIHFPYLSWKSISSISIENADKVGKRFCGIVLHQVHEK